MEVGAPKVTSGDNLVKETTSTRGNIKPMVPVEGNKKGWWVNTVNNQQPLIKHDLQVSEVDGVDCSSCSGRGSDEPLWKDFLVGRFLSAAPHVAKIHVIVNKVWPLGD